MNSLIYSQDYALICLEYSEEDTFIMQVISVDCIETKYAEQSGEFPQLDIADEFGDHFIFHHTLRISLDTFYSSISG